MLLAVMVTQWCTWGSFEHGYWTSEGFTPATTAETLWIRLPLPTIVLISVIFFVGVTWWVPEKGARGMIRVWGIHFFILSLLVSVGITFFGIVDFYMD